MDIARYMDNNMKMKNKKIEFEEQTYNYIDIICYYNDIQYAHLIILDLIHETNLQEFFINNINYDKYKGFERFF